MTGIRKKKGGYAGVFTAQSTSTEPLPTSSATSYATLLDDAGASVKTIQAIIGHSDVQTTINRYVHSRDKKKQEAVRSVNEMLVV